MPHYRDSDSSSSCRRSWSRSSTSPSRSRRRGRHKRKRSSSYSDEGWRRRSKGRSRTRRRSRSSKFNRRSHKRSDSKRELINVNISLLNQKFTRSARRLFVGNLPVGPTFTEAFFQHYFENEIVPKYSYKGLVSFWHAGAYGFAEFLSVRDTTRAKQELDGISLWGNKLRCRRPTDYCPIPDYLRDYCVGEPDPPMPEDFDLSKYPHVFGVQQIEHPRKPIKIKEMPLPGRGDLRKQLKRIKSSDRDRTPESFSKVFRIKNMITNDEMKSDIFFKVVIRKIRKFLGSLGTIESVVIPRKGELRDDSGVGKVYVQYASEVSLDEFDLEFEDRKLSVDVCDERKFALRELD